MRCLLQIFAALAIAGPIVGPPAMAANNVQARVAACSWIRTANQLQAMKNNLGGTYCLANDIDASAIANFKPIGDNANPFTGRLYGRGHVIRHLTISNVATYVGLFGYIDQATIQDVGLADVNISLTGTGTGVIEVGALVGSAVGSAGTSTIARVSVTGQIACTQIDCFIGGIAGSLSGISGTTLTDSWSAAQISGTGADAGGAVGVMGAGSAMIRTFASGSVTCTDCFQVGGLVGSSGGRVLSSYATGPVLDIHVDGGTVVHVGGAIGELRGTLQQSYASGPVSGAAHARAVGGLVGFMTNDGEVPSVSITESYAAGPVSSAGAGANVSIGGLVGHLNIPSGQAGSITESYAVGVVSAPAGAQMGGLVGSAAVTGTFTSELAYWDLDTTGQFSSAAGVARSTADMRSTTPCCLPGHSNPWAQTANLSYPYVNDPDLDFASPLATLVRSHKVFVFLPVSQLDEAQYSTAPAHADEAARAAVYTMIARAVGITDDVAQLKDVKIDTYFWNDATRTATWRGPVKTYVKRGALTGISASTPLDDSNVIGLMKKQRLVILRGTYRKSDGSNGTHWLLGTLFTTPVNADTTVSTIVANDPLTGGQIEIDPDTKQVLTPNFPLANFRINGYQSMAMITPPPI